MQAIVEPFHNKETDVMVARSLVDPSQGYIVLRVVNTTNFEKIIRENTCLAECQADANFGESIGKQETVNTRLCKLTSETTGEAWSDVLPDHLLDLYTSGGELLSETQKLQYKRLLQRYSNAFAKSKNDLGCTDLIQHKINTGDAIPIKQNPRRLPIAMQDEAEQELNRMLDAGVIEPSVSPWPAPTVI